jgi:glycosyltransferase involved in cell wall biosynthesis
MKLEVLVSTMDKNDLSLIETMDINSDVLIINQTSQFGVNLERHSEFNIRLLSYDERGLSKSRNKALSNAQGDICLFADDDVKYFGNYADTIIKAHQQYQKYEIIVFAVPTSNSSRRKSYYTRKKKMGYIRSLKITSVEISFKRESLIQKNIRFDEMFGTGSGKYLMGEENIFIYQCLNKGLNILYLPIEIGTVAQDKSTWFSGYNEKYFQDLGACYAAMTSKYSKLLALQYAIRKYQKYKASMSFQEACTNIFKGIDTYLYESKKRSLDACNKHKR